MIEVKVKEADIKQAVNESVDAFVAVFVKSLSLIHISEPTRPY